MATKTGEVNYLQKGEQGDIGPLVYPAGEYASGVTYTRTSLSAPMVLCEGQYYVLSKVGSFKGITPKTDYATNGSKATWVLMEKVQYAFFDVIMANFAKLASAVFHGHYMFSQQGVDAAGQPTSNYKGFGTDAFTPNLSLNFLTGEIRTSSGIFKGSVATPFGSGVISAQDRILDISTGFNFQYEGGGDIYLPNDEIYDGVECSLFSRFPQTAFRVKIVASDKFIDKDHVMNAYNGYATIVVSGKLLRLKAIKHTQKVYWYILNVNDFNEDELITY